MKKLLALISTFIIYHIFYCYAFATHKPSNEKFIEKNIAISLSGWNINPSDALGVECLLPKFHIGLELDKNRNNDTNLYYSTFSSAINLHLKDDINSSFLSIRYNPDRNIENKTQNSYQGSISLMGFVRIMKFIQIGCGTETIVSQNSNIENIIQNMSPTFYIGTYLTIEKIKSILNKNLSTNIIN